MAWLDLSIRGGSKEQKQMAESMIEYCIKALKLNRMNLEINVKIKPIKGAYGFCVWEDDNLRPREFSIELHKGMGKKNFLTTIAHEMVHVKQYAKGEMRERFKGDHALYWKGRDHSDTKYWDQPWEKEAYKLQETLMKGYMKCVN